MHDLQTEGSKRDVIAGGGGGTFRPAEDRDRDVRG